MRKIPFALLLLLAGCSPNTPTELAQTSTRERVIAYNAEVIACQQSKRDGIVDTFTEAAQCEHDVMDNYSDLFSRNSDVWARYRKTHLRLAQECDKQKISIEAMTTRTQKAWSEAVKVAEARDKKENARLAKEQERRDREEARLAKIRDAEVARWQEEHDPINIKCKSYGFKKGTTAFANCAMNLEQASIQEERQRAALQQEAEAERARRVAAALSAYAQWDRQRAQQQRPIQTNCSQFGYGFNCTTYP